MNTVTTNQAHNTIYIIEKLMKKEELDFQQFYNKSGEENPFDQGGDRIQKVD